MDKKKCVVVFGSSVSLSFNRFLDTLQERRGVFGLQ